MRTYCIWYVKIITAVHPFRKITGTNAVRQMYNACAHVALALPHALTTLPKSTVGQAEV